MTVDELIATGRYQLFHATSKSDLLLDYPELRNVPSFMSLTPANMMFVYYYAMRWSPAVQHLIDDKDRISFAMRRAWPENMPHEVKEKYPKHAWGDKVERAISDMRGYEPYPRVVMKLNCMVMLNNVKTLMSEEPPDKSEFDDTADFYKAVNEYYKAVKQGVELQNTLLPYTERNAFGVVEVEGLEEEEEGAISQWLHSTNN